MPWKDALNPMEVPGPSQGVVVVVVLVLPLERVGVGGAGRDHVGGDQDVLGADQGRVDQDVLHRGSCGSGCGNHGKGSLKAWSNPCVIPGPSQEGGWGNVSGRGVRTQGGEGKRSQGGRELPRMMFWLSLLCYNGNELWKFLE